MTQEEKLKISKMVMDKIDRAFATVEYRKLKRTILNVDEDEIRVLMWAVEDFQKKVEEDGK